MNSDKVAELRKLFPFIDDECKLNFGNGWFKLIVGFCGAVRYLSVDGIRITQLESRDDKLNIEYTGTGNSALDKAIAHVETRSTHTCERCGQEQPTSRTSSTLIWRIGNRDVRLCRECVDGYEIQKALGKEASFKI